MEGERLFEDMRRIRVFRLLVCTMEVIEQQRTIVRIRAVVDDLERALLRRLDRKSVV